MDMLRYKDVKLTLCFAGKSRRETHDMLRHIFTHRSQICVCPCVSDPWVREVLRFLDAQMNNEPSHTELGS